MWMPEDRAQDGRIVPLAGEAAGGDAAGAGAGAATGLPPEAAKGVCLKMA